MTIRPLVVQGNELLSSGFPKLSAETSIFDALHLFLKLHDYTYLPVFENGIFIGNLTIVNLLLWLKNEYKKEIDKRYNLRRDMFKIGTKLKNLSKHILQDTIQTRIIIESEIMIAISKDNF